MFSTSKNQDPILIEVRNGRYDCYGKSTVRSQYLFKILEKQGGISDTVEDGFYHYNVKLEGLYLVASLVPVK